MPVGDTCETEFMGDGFGRVEGIIREEASACELTQDPFRWGEGGDFRECEMEEGRGIEPSSDTIKQDGVVGACVLVCGAVSECFEVMEPLDRVNVCQWEFCTVPDSEFIKEFGRDGVTGSGE